MATPEQETRDAVALLTVLHHSGLQEFQDMILSEPLTYAQPKTLAYAVVIMNDALEAVVKEFNDRSDGVQIDIGDLLQMAGAVAATGELPQRGDE